MTDQSKLGSDGRTELAAFRALGGANLMTGDTLLIESGQNSSIDRAGVRLDDPA
jgi:hypothetical protein